MFNSSISDMVVRPGQENYFCSTFWDITLRFKFYSFANILFLLLLNHMSSGVTSGHSHVTLSSVLSSTQDSIPHVTIIAGKVVIVR